MRARSLLAFPLVVATISLLGALATGTAGCGGKKSRSAPHAPTMVGATAGDGHITVTWADSPGADLYIVYYASQEGVTQDDYDTLENGNRSYDVTSPVDIDVPNGQTYFFVVTAVSADGYESKDSQEVFAAPTNWLRPVVIETSGMDALAPRLVADGQGNLLAAWSRQQSDNRYSIHAARYDAGTGDWTPAAAIDSSAGFSYGVSLAGRADGRALAVWRQGNGTLDSIWANEFDSQNWGSPTLVELDDTGTARNPSVALSASSGLAAWTQFDGVSTDDLWANDYTSGGGWGTRQLVENTSGSADYAQVALDDAGNGLILFAQNGALLAAPVTAGPSIGTPVFVHGSNGASSISLAMNGAGDAIAAWLEPNAAGSDVWGARYTGGSWDPPVLLETAVGDAGAPKAAIAEDGDGVVVFPQVVGLHAQLFAVRFVDGQIELPLRIDDDDTGDVKEVAAAVANGRDALAVWTQEVAGAGGPGITKNVYANRYIVESSSWGPAVQAGRLYGLTADPDAVITSDGSAHLVFTRYGNNYNAVVSNTAPAPTPLP